METSPLGILQNRLSFDCPESLLARVVARYAEPHRRYHDWTHILACFDARDRLTQLRLPEVDLALLFHDAVYEPFASDNEAQSAELLVAEGRQAWLHELVLQRAKALVLATRHAGTEPDSVEAGIVLDADLSILGEAPAAFDTYERQVREEYAVVDAATYAEARSAILRGLLARPSIYATRRGQCLWESSARENLKGSLRRLAHCIPKRAVLPDRV